MGIERVAWVQGFLSRNNGTAISAAERKSLADQLGLALDEIRLAPLPTAEAEASGSARAIATRRDRGR